MTLKDDVEKERLKRTTEVLESIFVTQLAIIPSASVKLLVYTKDNQDSRVSKILGIPDNAGKYALQASDYSGTMYEVLSYAVELLSK